MFKNTDFQHVTWKTYIVLNSNHFLCCTWYQFNKHLIEICFLHSLRYSQVWWRLKKSENGSSSHQNQNLYIYICWNKKMILQIIEWQISMIKSNKRYCGSSKNNLHIIKIFITKNICRNTLCESNDVQYKNIIESTIIIYQNKL